VTIHVTIWWLWITLMVIYSIGVVLGMGLTLLADDRMPWYVRPLILVWPLTGLTLAFYHIAMFMIGRE
jgi:hypothetical protein